MECAPVWRDLLHAELLTIERIIEMSAIIIGGTQLFSMLLSSCR